MKGLNPKGWKIMSEHLIEEARMRRRQMLLTAFGPTIEAALNDPSVIEVMVNPDGRLWLDRFDIGRIDTGTVISPAEV